MKKILLIFALIYGVSEVQSQNWQYYTREISFNGVESEGGEPIMLEIDLLSNVIAKIASKNYNWELPLDSVSYTASSTGSHVILWECINPDGNKDVFFYYNDYAGDKIDFCALVDGNKICFLNIKRFE